MSTNSLNIFNLRRNYSKNELDERNVLANPLKQFQIWFEDAIKGDIMEPNAMVLATVESNQPKSRIVLLKEADDNGYVFFTNYRSHKGEELAENPRAALLFFWDKLERQVRIEGEISRTSSEVSDAYFRSRPRGSQIGAWVSDQSEVIANAEVLENKLQYYTQKFADTDEIPRPAYWGGYILTPTYFEFWQGRPNRLHDRIFYQKTENNDWQIGRLSP